MQPLPSASNCESSATCARELVDAVPPVLWEIRRTMRGFRRGVSVPQFRALVFIQSRPRMCLSTLAEYLSASLPTTSRIIAGLVRRKLVTRCGCSEDRRQLALSLTSKGHGVLKAAWQGTEEHLAKQLREMSPREHELICQAMRLLKPIFGALHGDIGQDLPKAASVSAGTVAKRRRRQVSPI